MTRTAATQTGATMTRTEWNEDMIAKMVSNWAMTEESARHMVTDVLADDMTDDYNRDTRVLFGYRNTV